MSEKDVLKDEETLKKALKKKVRDDRDFYDVLELEDDYNELLRGYLNEFRGFFEARKFLEKIKNVFDKVFERTSEGVVLAKSFSEHLGIMEELRGYLEEASSILEKAEKAIPKRGKAILLPEEYAKFLVLILPVYRYFKTRSGENLIQLNYCISRADVLSPYLKKGIRMVRQLQEGGKVYLEHLEEDIMVYLIDNFNSDGSSPLKRALKSFKEKNYDKVWEILFSEIPSQGIRRYAEKFPQMYDKVIESLKLRKIFDNLCRAKVSIWESIENPERFLEYLQQLYEIFHPLTQYA